MLEDDVGAPLLADLDHVICYIRKRTGSAEQAALGVFGREDDWDFHGRLDWFMARDGEASLTDPKSRWFLAGGNVETVECI